jgi:hypothetical protein
MLAVDAAKLGGDGAMRRLSPSEFLCALDNLLKDSF